MFRETTALGLRRSTVARHDAAAASVTVSTPFGDIAGVVATLPDGGERFSPEYEAVRTPPRSKARRWTRCNWRPVERMSWKNPSPSPSFQGMGILSAKDLCHGEVRDDDPVA